MLLEPSNTIKCSVNAGSKSAVNEIKDGVAVVDIVTS